MTINQFFQLIYYSHLLLVTSAMILSSSISAVLYQTIEWQVVLLTGLATYLTYSVDNLIDWKNEKAHYRNISTHIQIYHKLTYFLIPCSAVIILLLLWQSPNIFQISTGLLGAAAVMSTTRLPFYRTGTVKPDHHVWHFILNRIFISAVWTAVVVFLPILYGEHVITIRIWRAFFYIYGMIVVYASLWRLERVESELQEQLRKSNLLSGLSFLALFSMAIVVIDVKTGLAPVYGLINILPPITCLVATMTFGKNSRMSWQKLSLFTLSLMILSSFTTLFHLSCV